MNTRSVLLNGSWTLVYIMCLSLDGQKLLCLWWITSDMCSYLSERENRIFHLEWQIVHFTPTNSDSLVVHSLAHGLRCDILRSGFVVRVRTYSEFSGVSCHQFSRPGPQSDCSRLRSNSVRGESLLRGESVPSGPVTHGRLVHGVSRPTLRQRYTFSHWIPNPTDVLGLLRLRHSKCTHFRLWTPVL